jgi:hypothetical protein
MPLWLQWMLYGTLGLIVLSAFIVYAVWDHRNKMAALEEWATDNGYTIVKSSPAWFRGEFAFDVGDKPVRRYLFQDAKGLLWEADIRFSRTASMKPKLIIRFRQ